MTADWNTLLEQFRGDDDPWLIVPDDPVAGDACAIVSRAQLADQALRVASALRRLGARPGDRIIVLADNSADCCLLLLGALVGGMVAVPIAPRARTQRAGRERMVAAIADGGARFFVGQAATLADELSDLALPDTLQSFSLDSLVGLGEPTSQSDVSRDQLALIQYTSGTTSRARGVALTHDNLWANLEGIHEAIRLQPGDVALCWLPLFHDMGLIGTLLSSTVWRVPLVLMTPASFVLRPESWLWAISRFRVVSCAAPNSAYQLCATRLPEERLDGLDLSSWRFAFNGAELIQPSTVEAFCRRFEPYGFRRETMYPVYGLAEHTVAATLGPAGRGARIDWVDRQDLQRRAMAVPRVDGDRRGVVCVGRPLKAHDLRVVNTHTEESLGDRTVGDIQLRGSCVMSGYYAAPHETALVLTRDGWLSTGDRGYIVDGELYVVGRTKHVVKHAGASYDACDIATSVEAVDGVRYGSVAVFGVPDRETGTEALAVIAETRVSDATDRTVLERAIRRCVQRRFGLRPAIVVLAEPRSVPRTTSGKVQHSLAAQLYEETLGIIGPQSL